MGHAFNYTIGDIIARFKKLKGFNVIHPMGFDSFGLPAENAAIKAKSYRKKFTEAAIKQYIKQQKALGFSYDWSVYYGVMMKIITNGTSIFLIKIHGGGISLQKEEPS